MKELNKKGFTLIELLAVIVILTILVAVSVPAVTKYLNSARKSTYVINAQVAVAAVRDDVITSGYTTDMYYPLDKINPLLQKKLIKSTFGSPYTSDSYIAVRFDEEANATYSICLTDGSNGFGLNDEAVLETDLDESHLYTGKVNAKCIAPTDISPVE